MKAILTQKILIFVLSLAILLQLSPSSISQTSVLVDDSTSESATVAIASAAAPLIAGLAIAATTVNTAFAVNDLIEIGTGNNLRFKSSLASYFSNNS